MPRCAADSIGGGGRLADLSYASVYRQDREVEARGVEPLSSKLSTQASTCVAGEIFKGPNLAPAHCRPPIIHEILHRPARSLHRTTSLLSMFPAVAGVQPETSRSIKPRELDLGDLRFFVLVRILTRPTNHPRHAACASNYESKPVRPHFGRLRRYENRASLQADPGVAKEIPCGVNPAAARVADAGAESVRQLGRGYCFQL